MSDQAIWQFADELELCLTAQYPLIMLVTQEETRAVDAVKSACRRVGQLCHVMSVPPGLQPPFGKTQIPDVRTLFDSLPKAPKQTVLVLLDFDDLWKSARGGDSSVSRRQIIDAVLECKMAGRTIVVVQHSAEIPGELQNEAHRLDVPSPRQDELDEVLSRVADSGDDRKRPTGPLRENLAQAALGMTASQADRAYRRALVRGNGRFRDDAIAMVMEEKKQIIRSSEALEFFPVSETESDVGGLGALKQWLRQRANAFGQEARQYRLPPPKGILLLGIPGTGKSLTAKMIGGLWQVPVLRLDIGAMFGSLVGESEERARRSLQLAETVAPCVLWIDEIEKGLGQQGARDGGTSTRVFGTILTWMQERKAPCFVIATANSIDHLPPELLRRGRFDELFFIDLPNEAERREIFRVHLEKRSVRGIAGAGGDWTGFDLDKLKDAFAGYTGADIEQAIIEAMYDVFNEPRGKNQPIPRDFTTEDILKVKNRILPLSQSDPELLTRLRQRVAENKIRSATEG